MSTFSPNVEPPVLQDDFDTQPGWPKPVGIISIVWGALGLTCGLCGLVGLSMMPAMMKGAEDQMGVMPDIMKPSPLQMVAMVAGFVPTIVLIVAGVLTVRRNFTGRLVHLIYVGLAIFIGGIGIAMQIQQQMALSAWAAENPDNMWAKQQQQGGAFAYIGIAFGVLLSFAWPLFCAIWFGFVKRRPEDFGQVRTNYI
jgi:hypothetical protein